MNKKDTVFEILQSLTNTLGVISTVNASGGPEAASVYYLCDDKGTIFFITRKNSRKYKNIEHNPKVAFVITNEHPSKTIQYEGIASEVSDTEETIEFFNALITKATGSDPMPPVIQMEGGEMAFMKITPTWIRYGDFQLMKQGEMFDEVTV